MKLNQVLRLVEREGLGDLAQCEARIALAFRGIGVRGWSGWWRKAAHADFQDTQPSVRDGRQADAHDVAR